LRLDWKTAADSLVVAGKKIDEVPRPAIFFAGRRLRWFSLARSLERESGRKIDRALALVCGACGWREPPIEANFVIGETIFRFERRRAHREGNRGRFWKSRRCCFPPEWSVTKEEPESRRSLFALTISAARESAGGAARAFSRGGAAGTGRHS